MECDVKAPVRETVPDWEDLLARAVSGASVSLNFQPIVDVSQRAIVGYEALARFDGPIDLTPDRWFGAARSAGLGSELELAVLHKSLQARADLPPSCFLSVNVEPDALVHPAVSTLLLAQASLEGLVIELTEHVDAERVVGLQELLEQIRFRGAKVAVDDAGAGYAGLKQILELRPDYLKIDRALVADLDRDDAHAALVDMLGAFASRLDAWLIAEGVERPGELDRLRRLRVPLVQGYLLGRPSPTFGGMDPAGAGVLAATPVIDEDMATIRTILETATWVPEDEVDAAHRMLAERPDVEVVILVDGDRRPVGCVDRTTRPGELRTVWRAWAGTPVRDLARRIGTRPAEERFAATVCCDAAGRLLGVVRVERLLFELSA